MAREGQVVGSSAQRLFVDIGQDNGGAPLGEGLCGGRPMLELPPVTKAT